MALQTLKSVGFDKYIPFSTSSNGVVDFGDANIATPKVTAREFLCVNSEGCGRVSITDDGIITIGGKTIQAGSDAIEVESLDADNISVESFMEGAPGRDGKGAYTRITCGLVESTRGADMCFSGATEFPKAVFKIDEDGLKMLVKTSASTSGGYCVDSYGNAQLASTTNSTLYLGGSQTFKWGPDGDVQDGRVPVGSGSAEVLKVS